MTQKKNSQIVIDPPQVEKERTGSFFFFLILKGRDLRRVVTDQTSLVLYLCLRVEPFLSPLVSNIPTLKIRAWRRSLLTHSLHPCYTLDMYSIYRQGHFTWVHSYISRLIATSHWQMLIHIANESSLD